MTLVFFVYLASILPNIIGMLDAVTAILSVALILVLCVCILEFDATEFLKVGARARALMFPLIVVLTVALLVRAMTPTPRDAYVVAGTWMAKEVVTSDTSSKLLSNVRDWLQKEIKAMKQRKTEEGK